MADAIISVLLQSVLSGLGSLAIHGIKTQGVKDQLNKLENTLSTVNAVILNAGEHEMNNPEVKDLLAKLKDVVYDADNLLDELAYEDFQRQVGARAINKVNNLFSHSNPLVFNFKMGRKIKQIQDRLDEIAENRRKFFLTNQVVRTRVASELRQKTHPFVKNSKVTGREKDIKKILKLLLHHSGDVLLSVIPIVGIGGIGKTTLAKLVYDHPRVVDHFDLRVWVTMSENFDLEDILKAIIENETDIDTDDLDMNQLQTHIKDILNKQRYLLVLDDVGTDKCIKSVDLKKVLSCGARGSKILVTTRAKHLAENIGTLQPYHLPILGYEDCWSIFTEYAFGWEEEDNYQNLVEIGKEIVGRCGGIPLVAKTLGGMLVSNFDKKHWEFVKEHCTWRLPQNTDDILPILKFCYDVMPSYLKPCFAYCSIFAKNDEFNARKIVSIWIAQGYIQQPIDDGSGLELEDIGNEYFMELVSRSFFQDIDMRFDNRIQTCKMHDLVHDLAQSVAGSEWLVVDSDTTIIPKGVRHLVYKEKELSGKELPKKYLVQSEEEANKLRSFVISDEIETLSKSFIESLVRNFRCIRVLDLSGSEFEQLPSSIGCMKHLRYLILDSNFQLRTLPNSICKLHNLQRLSLHKCSELEELPKDIMNMMTIRHLTITSQQIYLPEKGLQQHGWTIDLRFLWLYKCSRLISLPKVIKQLTKLRELYILRCPLISSVPNTIICLKSLEILRIINCREIDLSNFEKECISKHNPCWQIQSLALSRLPKLENLPAGLVNYPATLEYLHVKECRNLKALPKFLKALTSLKALGLVNCRKLSSLPKGLHRLKALQKLDVSGSPRLSERCETETGEDWDKISHVPEIIRDD